MNILEHEKYSFNEVGKTIFINIAPGIIVKWEIQDSNIFSSDDNIKELCNFIIGNIWISLFKYLIQHRWKINKWLKIRINEINNKLIQLLILKNKIDRISFYYKNDYSSIIEFIFRIISLSSFNCVSLKLIEKIFSRNFSSPIINKLFEGIEYSIETLYIKPPYVVGLFDIFDIDEYDKHILSEYSNDYPTLIIYKFLVKSKLIYSIKNIELEFTHLIDYDLLFKLISEFKSKISPECAFCLSYIPSLELDIYHEISDLYRDKIKNIHHWIINKKDQDDNIREMYNIINDAYDSYDGSGWLQNRFITEVIKDNSPFMRSNKLLMFSLFYKRMKLAFLVYLLEAELSKPNGDISKYKIELINFKTTKEGHIANWKIEEHGLEFTLITTDEEFVVKQTDIQQDKLKSLGFSGINVEMQDKIIEELLVEYLEFVVFPLYLQKINSQNRKMIDKV